MDELSAFLDGELDPPQRAGVEAHLRQCPACARHVEELAAVDTLARGLSVEAPAGYFLGLPQRVVQRLPPRSAPRVRRIPGWTWALAAGLLIAVAGPLVWQERALSPVATAPMPEQLAGAPSPREDPRPSPAMALPATAPPATTAFGRDAERREKLKGLGYVGTPPEPAPPAPLEDRGQEGDVSGGRAREGFAARPGAVAPQPEPRRAPAAAPTDGVRSAERGFASGPPPQAPPPPPASTADGPVRPVPTDARGPAALSTHERTPEREAVVEEALAPAKKAEAERKEARQRADSARGGMAGATRRMTDPAAAQFEGLSARAPASAQEARALREAWRMYIRQHPQDVRLDEAWLRMIEAGADTYRRSQGADDLAVLRQDTRAYLRDTETPQTARVRKAMEGIPPEP
jgi:anti-sigma factor RsiW